MPMKISHTQLSSQKVKSLQLLVLPICQTALASGRGKQAALLQRYSQMLGSDLRAILLQEDFQATHLTTTHVRLSGASSSTVVLCVGWDNNDLSSLPQHDAFRFLGSIIAQISNQYRLDSCGIEGPAFGFADEKSLRDLMEGIELSQYRFEEFLQPKPTRPSSFPRQVSLFGDTTLATGKQRKVSIVTKATCFARDLVNLPAMNCTPNYLVTCAKKLARQSNVSCKIYGKSELQKMKAGAILAVAQGSAEAPSLITLHYKPGKKAKTCVALVGKGVTFDSGGLSMKSAAGMLGMKADMSGAAAVLGAFQAIALLKPNVEVRGYVPTVENMVSDRALRPGDVIRCLSGKTVEVVNTDAEGRLILADALTLADREGADIIIDLATLTGACVVALGTDIAGLFTEDDGLRQMLERAGKQSGDGLWHMPMLPQYRDLIQSPIADMKNSGAREGGAIIAALFLKEFVSRARWAHIDIAGPAFRDKARYYSPQGASGFGVRLLTEFIGAL